MYPLIKPLLFSMDAEHAHHLVTQQLRLWSRIGVTRKLIAGQFAGSRWDTPVEYMGLTFPNAIGLAAGFDKDARYLQGMQALGFGFVEVGTVTPRAQPGNPKPRLFRLPADAALINRLGFNNHGLAEMQARLERRPDGLVVGGNIGKNKDTPNDEAVNDYVTCFQGLHELVDYFVVNVSSPNTPGLRSLQDREPLTRILGSLQEINTRLAAPRPILLKIAPDLEDEQVVDTVALVRELGITGMVGCNTTIRRDGLNTSDARLERIGAGGLSGPPVRARSTEVIRLIRQEAGDDFVIIGVGGISSPADAKEKIAAGANLLQIYTGFIYGGPALVTALKKALR